MDFPNKIIFKHKLIFNEYLPFLYLCYFILMKALWITNTLFPDVCKTLKIETPVIGGWMNAAASSLLNLDSNLILAVATVYDGNGLQKIQVNRIIYYLIPKSGNYWMDVTDDFNPDLVHIHGTETSNGIDFINACGNKNVVVSIQGLVSIYERYYFGGIDEKTLLINTTLRDIVRNDTIFQQRENMQQRGIREKRILRSAEHIIGRTSWDEAHCHVFNHRAKYHFCNESLRDAFYTHQWEYENCEKFSIFISQAHYPLKGMHKILLALPLLKEKFPNIKLYIAGNDIISKQFWRLSGFAKYLLTIIKKHNLQNSIVFTGLLNESEMCQRYLKSHVFVCPSSIENSPNSVGEAQLLGVPCVGAYVGGMSDMITDGETGMLYRFEEIEMLSEHISKIFSNPDFAKRLSKNEREIASVRHDRVNNSVKLKGIYDEICKT